MSGVTQTSQAVVLHFGLPATNFTMQATSATCKGSNNGSIKIIATQALPYNFTATNGNTTVASGSFTNTSTITNLPAGSYNVCVTITGQTYQQCFTVVITEPKDLAVYAAVNNNTNSVNLTMTGASTYNIQLNGASYSSATGEITLPLSVGDNLISVSTDKPCQGVVEKRIVISGDITAYPNPFTNSLTLSLGSKAASRVSVEVFSTFGKLVYSKQYVNQAGEIILDLSNLAGTQMYVLKLTMDNSQFINKIIKK